MTKLLNVAQILAKRAKAILPNSEFGTASQEEFNKVREVLPLSDDLTAWYMSIAPSYLSIPLIGNDLLIYPLERLILAQNGYRWSGLSDTPERLESWLSEWLVIGDIGADPIIAHTNKTGTPISGVLHGTGKWEPRLIAPDLITFIQCVTVLVDTVEQFSEEHRFTEDLSLHPEVIAYLKNHLEPLLSADLINNFIWFRYG